MANQKDFRVKNGLVVEEGATIAGLVYPTTDGQPGQFLTTDGSGNLTFGANPLTEATGEPLGHLERTDSVIAFNNATRTFTIDPVSTSYVVWTKGVKRTYTTTQSVTIPDVSGLYYIYFDPNGVLQYKTSFFDWANDTMTAYVYWNSDTQTAPFVADERHGVVLDWQTHEYLHRTRGAVIANGFSASNYVIGGDGSLDTHAQVDISGGTFFDEDLQVDIIPSNTPTPNTWEQDLTGPAQIPVFFLNGTTWEITTPTNFPLKFGTSVPQYNEYNSGSGTWSAVDVTDGKYLCSWIIATNNINYPVIAIMGQAAKDNAGDAEARTFQELNLPGFPIVELRPLYKLIYRCSSSYTNTIKASLQSVWDLRNIVAVSPAASLATDHGNLSGLGDDDHLQYIHVSEARNVTAEHTFGGTQTFNNIDASGNLGVTGNVVIDGNLTVNGTQTILSTNVLQVQDNIITLNAEATGAPSANAGIEVERGDSLNVQVRWNETNDKWEFTNDGSAWYDFIPLNPSAGAGRVLQANQAGTDWQFGDVVLGSQSRDSFTGDGSTTAFTLQNVYGGQNSILVFIDGVIQYPGANFTLSGTTLTFLGTPVLESRIEVFGLTPVTSEITPGDGTVTAKKLAASAYTRDIFTGNGTQTVFNLSGDVGSELAPFVYVGGILQDPITHYSIDVLAIPQTITFTSAIPNATEVTVVYGPVNVTGVPSDATITFAKMAPSVFEFDTFTGDGTTTEFTLSQAVLAAKYLLVTVASVMQTPETSYTAINNTITFSAPPPNGAAVLVRYYVGTSILVPTDNSVSTIKIQDGAVTKDKLSFNPEDDAVALSIALG